MKKTLRIFAKMKEVEINKRKQKIAICSYVNSKGKWFGVKFKQTCMILPKETGYYLLDTEDKWLSKENGEKYSYTNENGEIINGVSNDTIWVENVNSLTRDTEYEEIRKTELNAELMTELE